MKFNKLKWTLGALALAVTGITNPAAAADSSGWYLGAGVGQSRATIAHKEIRDDLLASGFTTTDFDRDEEDFAYKLFAGYQFNRNFALEAGYFDLGEFDYTATTVPTGTKTGELEFQGWNFDLVGTIPLSERAGLFGRIGVHRSEAEVEFAGTGAVNVLQPRFSETATKFKAGIGFQYRMTDSLALRVEAERYRMDDAVGNDGDLDLLSASLVYQFQRPAPAPAPRAQRPAEPVLAAQEVVVVPLPVATEQYCSLLDIQFEIDQDKIQREEEEKLAVVATFLQRYPNTGAVIEGHTDNVGSAASNLQLSQRRAESVVDYLVREHGIERSRLQAEGYGETRPIADNSTQEGQRANRRIATIIGCATDIAGLEPLPARMTLAMEMEFDRNSAAIKPQYDNQLRNFAKFLAANPSLTATMEGHADNASPDMAQRISRERAQSVANYLVEQFGVDRSRLGVQGYGETRRFAYNISEEGRQQNRRVNIILDYKD